MSSYIEQALLHGVDRAHLYFEQFGGPFDPWFFSHFVRFESKHWLKGSSLYDTGFEVVDVAMSGLWIRNNRYNIRIWKEDVRVDSVTKQLIPRIQPGRSYARHNYFTQPQLDLEFPDDLSTDFLTTIPQVTNLVINWSLDKSMRLSTFELACLSLFDSDDNNVVTHWWVPIPRLDTSINAASIEVVERPLTILEDLVLDINSDSNNHQ